MSNLYLKVDKIEDVTALPNADCKMMRACTKGDFFHFLVKKGEAPETLDLDEHEESIRELLRSVRKMDTNDKIKVFGPPDLYSIMDTYTISEIREKYNEWKKPKVGDEVRYGSHTGIVILFKEILGEKNALLMLRYEGTTITAPIANIKKTGKHFEKITIEELGKYANALPRPKKE